MSEVYWYWPLAPTFIHSLGSSLTERKYLHFTGTRAEDLIVINIPTVGILLDLAKWEDSKYLVAKAPARLSIAQNARILSNVKLRIGAAFLQQQFPGGSDWREKLAVKLCRRDCFNSSLPPKMFLWRNYFPVLDSRWYLVNFSTCCIQFMTCLAPILTFTRGRGEDNS